jgi:LysM repeat protein
MGLMGTLEQQGDQVVLSTQDGLTLIMPELPAELRLPMENVYALGTQVGDTYEWRSIDLRAMGGGGGGGGSTGLYGLNLSGTPIPFPTASLTPTPVPGAFASAYPYTVAQGDTLGSIAALFGTTPEELMRVNGMTDPGSLSVGQVLLVPAPDSMAVEGMRGLLNVTIFKTLDGTLETRYTFVDEGGHNYYTLRGNLEGLDEYQNRPILVWGTAEIGQDSIDSLLVVDRFEPVHPQVSFQIVYATTRNDTVEGQPVNLLTLDDGKTYVALFADGTPHGGSLGNDDTRIQAEVLILPDEGFGGYPALRVFGTSSMDQGDGKPFVLELTASEPYFIDESLSGPPEEMPTATIDKIELVYFIVNARYKAADPEAGPAYVQPMWRFTGHYSTGGEFEVLIQALKPEYLSPEIQMLEGPG